MPYALGPISQVKKADVKAARDQYGATEPGRAEGQRHIAGAVMLRAKPVADGRFALGLPRSSTRSKAALALRTRISPFCSKLASLVSFTSSV